MKISESLAVIAERLKVIEGILSQYSAAVRTEYESNKADPQRVRAEIVFDEASKAEAKTEADRQHSTQEKIARYAFYAFLAAVFYAGVSAVQLYELRTQTAQVFKQSEIENANASGQNAQLFRQLNIAQKEANAARDSANAITKQMQEDQRAWLTISAGNVSWSEGHPITVPVTVTNIGKTAAKKYTLSVVVKEIDNTLVSGKNITFKYAGVPRTTDSSGYVLLGAPDSVVANTLETSPNDKTAVQPALISHDEAVRLSAGTDFIMIYAETRYRDIFGVNHWTRFCTFNSPPGKIAYARKCTDYSDVDSN